MVRVEDVTEKQSKNVKRRNRNLDDLNIGSQPKESSKSNTPVSNDSNEVAEVQAEGDNEGEENSEGVEGEVRELSFNEQVDRAREQFQPTPLEKFLAIAKSMILRALVIYFIMSFIRGNTSSPGSSPKVDPNAPPSLASSNMWPNGTEFDMYVYVTEEKDYLRNFSNAQLIWKQERLIYGDWYGGPKSDGSFETTVNVELSKRVQNNGSIFIHAFMLPVGHSPDPQADPRLSKGKTIHETKMLNKFKKKRFTKTHNLLTGETAASIEDQEKAKVMSSEIVSHWHPNMTICLVTDWTAWTMGSVPSPLKENLHFNPMENTYQPILFFNDYWNLAKDYQLINSTTKSIAVTIIYQPLSLFKWQIYAAQAMRNQWQPQILAMGEGEEDDDQDTLKEAILDTNPILLALTFVVSILHSIFEFLAFKNDIQFWNNRKSLEGLSVRSVFFNVFQSLIVLLYILDNETNFVIRISVFVGLLIEIWKINKVTDVKIDRENKILGVFPRIRLEDKGSYVESSTRQYDILAFKYLSWVLAPLLLAYGVYSVLYLEHKGWYSWVLNMLYGFLLTFGFIMMTPQLFINYKLKSVAHLPWRMLSYKFLNTFIDDIFAFVIKMPFLYRVGVFRDDIIFFIYLYQRWIYRIDPTRVNEFGFSAEMLDQKDKQVVVASNEPSTSKNSQEKSSKVTKKDQ